MWYWQKDRPVDPWTRTENPEINPHIYYCQLIFDLGTKASFTQIISSTNVVGTTEQSPAKQTREPHCIPHIIYTNELSINYRPRCKI